MAVGVVPRAPRPRALDDDRRGPRPTLQTVAQMSCAARGPGPLLCLGPGSFERPLATVTELSPTNSGAAICRGVDVHDARERRRARHVRTGGWQCTTHARGPIRSSGRSGDDHPATRRRPSSARPTDRHAPRWSRPRAAIVGGPHPPGPPGGRPAPGAHPRARGPRHHSRRARAELPARARRAVHPPTSPSRARRRIGRPRRPATLALISGLRQPTSVPSRSASCTAIARIWSCTDAGVPNEPRSPISSRCSAMSSAVRWAL